LATALPLMEPINALDTTDASAGPPFMRPVRAYAISIKNCPAPKLLSSSPKMIYSATKDTLAPMHEPKMDSDVQAR